MNRRHLINQLVVMAAQMSVFVLCSSILLGGVDFVTGDSTQDLLHWVAPIVLFVAVVLTSVAGNTLDKWIGEDFGGPEVVFAQARPTPAQVCVTKEVKSSWEKFRLTGTLETRVIICDGAMGTELIRRDPGHKILPSWWNMEHAEVIQSIHEEYINAGAQVVLTNTFGANRKKSEKYGEQKYTVQELNQTGVEIARRACEGRDVLVFGDIGPSGCEQELFYSNENGGAKIRESLYDVFKEQAIALAEAGADAICIEAVGYLHEAVIAVSAASENTMIPVICSMSFRKAPASQPDDFRTFWGDNVSVVLNELKKAGAVAVGSNCGEIVEEMPRLARNMRAKTDLPLIFEMNAGLPRLVRKESFEAEYSLEAGVFAEIMIEVVNSGGNIVGGCCGTRPEHIAAFRQRVNQFVR